MSQASPTPSSPKMDYAGTIDIDDMRQTIQSVFRNLTTARRFALDIGGSLAKIAYQSKRKRRRTLVRDTPVAWTQLTHSNTLYDGVEDEEVRDCLHFIKFETQYLEECLDFIREKILTGDESPQRRVKVTGGGAHKYRVSYQSNFC